MTAFNGHATCAQMLIDASADVEPLWRGQSPLEVARASGHSACVSVLEGRGIPDETVVADIAQRQNVAKKRLEGDELLVAPLAAKRKSVEEMLRSSATDTTYSDFTSLSWKQRAEAQRIEWLIEKDELQVQLANKERQVRELEQTMAEKLEEAQERLDIREQEMREQLTTQEERAQETIETMRRRLAQREAELDAKRSERESDLRAQLVKRETELQAQMTEAANEQADLRALLETREEDMRRQEERHASEVAELQAKLAESEAKQQAKLAELRSQLVSRETEMQAALLDLQAQARAQLAAREEIL